jgi:hypothetical protein
MANVLTNVCNLGEKRKWRGLAVMSQFDPQETLAVTQGVALKATRGLFRSAIVQPVGMPGVDP